MLGGEGDRLGGEAVLLGRQPAQDAAHIGHEGLGLGGLEGSRRCNSVSKGDKVSLKEKTFIVLRLTFPQMTQKGSREE